MSATTTRPALARRLESWRASGDCNWRLRGLLLALSDGVKAEDVGRAWPRAAPSEPRSHVHLGRRTPDTDESAIARSLYDADQLQHGEWVHRDEYISRALVQESETEVDVLWREELKATIAMGAATRKIARDATTVTEVEARKGDVPVRSQEAFASTGAESAGGEFDEQDYTNIAYDCEKHEQGFAITDELADQAEPDALEDQIQQAGAAVENAINRQHLINVVDSATQNHTVGSNEVAVQDVMEAAENVSDNDFDPSDVLEMHPEFRTELADDPALAGVDWGGEEDQGNIGSAFGIDLYVASDATYNGLADEHLSDDTSNTWGWEASGEIGGVVYGSEFVHTVVYQDVAVSELRPPFAAIHDLQGGVATAWTDSVQASTDAISTITQ